MGRTLLVIALIWGVALGGWAQDKKKKSKTELGTDLKTVKSKIKKARQEIRAVKRKEGRLVDQIETIEGRITATESRLDRVKRRLAVLASDQARLKERISVTRKRLADRQVVLGRRIRASYVQGNSAHLKTLVLASNMNDYRNRSYYLERMVDFDVKLVESFNADRKQLEADVKRLEDQEREQVRLKAQLREDKIQYKADISEKRDVLQETRETRESLQEMLDQLEESSKDIEARLRAMQETPRGKARMQVKWSGSFVKPADGPVTSGFGMRHHPILKRSKMHTGVDIGAGYGSTIRAADTGEVILAGYMRGYGNTVIVDHGGGVSTLYGHCSSLLVSTGQSVKRGQPIAKVGSTGMSTGPHLHFEKRVNGTPVNPY